MMTSVSDFYARHVFGLWPTTSSVQLSWEVLEEGPSTDDGIRRQLRLDLTGPTGRQMRVTLLVNLPSSGGPVAQVPAFCGMNFRGNHTCTTDPYVLDPISETEAGDPLHFAPGREIPRRADQGGRWAFDAITGRGWASITWCYLQLGPDSPAVFHTGPHRLYSEHTFEQRDPSEWGAISIWAWTMSKVLDALVAGMIPEIDPARIIAHGHSRLGKTAIWAGASDPRFAAVISNDSGSVGAAVTRDQGSTPARLLRLFPHWVVPTYSAVVARWQAVFAGRHDPELPDQPDLMALIAPRPLYVASASKDLPADPEGEYLSWQRASKAWPGGIVATAGDFPMPGEIRAPSDAPVGYHLREGNHDVTRFDWLAWLDFADRWVR